MEDEGWEKNTVTEAHGEGIRIYGACLKEGSCLSKHVDWKELLEGKTKLEKGTDEKI